jgi:hypothetical protein
MEKIDTEDRVVSQKRGIEEIEKAIQKFEIVNKNKWWLRLNESDPRLFALIINLVAKVGEGVAKNDPKFDAKIHLTDQISRWISQGLIKINIDSNKSDDLKSQSPIKEKTQKKNDSIADPTGAKITSKFSAIDSALKSLDEKMEKNLFFSRNMYDQGNQHSDESLAQLKRGLENVLNQNLDNFQKIEKFISPLFQDIKINFENINDLKKDLEILKEHSSQRIYIRDSVQILEIKEEIEKFVKSDLIRKISLAIMPTIESLHEAKAEEMPKLLEDLYSQCCKAGLIPTEKLFS